MVEAGMENVRRYRAMASMCRQQAALYLEIGWIWLARADRWQSLVEAEIEAHYRAAISFREEPVARAPQQTSDVTPLSAATWQPDQRPRSRWCSGRSGSRGENPAPPLE
jgi:hypothetical protein